MTASYSDFDIDDPHLPKEIARRAFASGNYPYTRKMDAGEYEETLRSLQIELVKLQGHLLQTGGRVVLIFEGRDAAGKGSTISRYLSYLNPRHSRVVALDKPTETERGQWYFQRYARQLPTAGEQVLFDRSWYNRGVVEPVMGFCTAQQTERFLQAVPAFERMIVEDGICFHKFWLNIGREMQIKRFHERRHNPLKRWKLSAMDVAALDRWDDYTQARDRMLRSTDTRHAPWTVILANDKLRARVNLIRQVLRGIEYPEKNDSLVEAIDPNIVMSADTFLARSGADQ